MANWPGRLRTVRPTRRGAAALGAGVSFGVLGIVLALPDLVALGAACLAAVAVSWVWLGSPRLDAGRAALAVERTITPHPIQRGHEADVLLTVRPERPSAAALDRLRSVRLAEQAHHMLAGPEGVRARVFTHLDRIEVRYQISPRWRGRFPLGPVSATRTDLFGLVTARVNLGTDDDVLVWPATNEVEVRSDMLGDLERAGVGSRLPSLEDSVLREYVAGDDPRRVHWLSAARLGQLMVRTDEAAGPRPITVLLDRSLIGLGDDWAVETAASLACSLLSAGHPTRIIASDMDETELPEHLTGASGRGVLLDSTVDLDAPSPPDAGAGMLTTAHSLRIRRGRDDVLVALTAPISGDPLAEMAALGMEAAGGWALVTRGVGSPETVRALRRSGWIASEVSVGDEPARVWATLTERVA